MTSFLFFRVFYIIADNFFSLFFSTDRIIVLYVDFLIISLLNSECDTCSHRTFIVQSSHVHRTVIAQPSYSHRTAIAHEIVCDARANAMHWVRNAIVWEELEKLLLH